MKFESILYSLLPLFFAGLSFLFAFTLIKFLKEKLAVLHLKCGKKLPGKFQSKLYLLGGAILCFSTLLTILILYFIGFIDIAKFVPFMVTVLSFLILGLTDDIYDLPPLFKLIVQVLIAVVYIYISGIGINNFYNFLGINELGTDLSFVITAFLIVLFVNMINMIDGIDGLCSSLCLLASLFFAYYAFLTNSDVIFFTNLILASSLIAFIYFNIFSPFTIYMGDNGAYILGFYMIVHCLWFINDNAIVNTPNFSPVLLLSLFSYPFLDLTRVVFIRLKLGLNPMKGDQNHLHHKLVGVGLSHGLSSLYIILVTFIIVVLNSQITQYDVNFQVFITLITGLFLFHLPLLFKKSNAKIKIFN